MQAPETLRELVVQASHLGFRSVFVSKPPMDARLYSGFPSGLYYEDAAGRIWKAMLDPAKRLLVIALMWW